MNFGATRIGVHAGPALVGNFGGSRFFDYTAYGDTINTAARLEAANKFLGTRICVSAAVAERPRIFAGGRSAISCCAGAASRCAPTSRCRRPGLPERRRPSIREAFAKLEAGDAAAMPAFAALVGTACRRRAGGLSSEAVAQRRQGRSHATGIAVPLRGVHTGDISSLPKCRRVRRADPI